MKDQILKAIPSTEPATWYEFVNALGSDAPNRGDKKGWWDVFQVLDGLERDGLIEVERDDGQIESVILTESGAHQVRAAQS